MYNLLHKWRTIPNDDLAPDLPEGFEISYQFRHLSGECPDVHTFKDNFHAVVDIVCGPLSMTLLAGPNWLCVEGKSVVLSSKEGTPFERMFDSDYERLFGYVLANYMTLSNPDLDDDFASERCGVGFSHGLPIRTMDIVGTRH